MKDNLDKTDNELLGERVEQIVLNETSRLQKAKRRFLHPAHNHIRSICIITSQNPFGVKAPRKENDALAKDLEMRLRVEKFPFYPVRGKYGSVERSYMIFNIGLDDAKLIGHRYDQQSFIYIVVDETGGMEFQLWWKDKESTRQSGLSIYRVEDEVSAARPRRPNCVHPDLQGHVDSHPF